MIPGLNGEAIKYVFLDLDDEEVKEHCKDELRTALVLHFGSIDTEQFLIRQLTEAEDAMAPIRKHVCELLSTVFGFPVINVKVDLEHKSRIDLRQIWSTEEKKVVTEVVKKRIIYYRECREDPEGNKRKQDHEYAFDPRTRRGLILEHVWKVMYALQSLEEAWNDIHENLVTRIHAAVERIENGDE